MMIDMKHALNPLLLITALCLAGPLVAQTDSTADTQAAEPAAIPVDTAADAPVTTDKDGALPKGVVAMVNGRAILQTAVDNVAEQVSANGQTAEPERILNELINLEVLTQHAEKLDLDQQPEVAVALHLQYTQTMGNAYLASISADVDITDAALRAEYDRQTANVDANEFRASHVLLETEEAAIEVIEELAGGADFAELAKARSIGPTGVEGGDLGWFQSSTMLPEFADAVNAMEVGTSSEKPVKTDFGWHVIMLADKRGAALPDFDAVKPGLRNLVLRDELAKRVKELTNQANIQR
jgi:peptidyl-prolyl cis-trans isomerase C